MTLPEIVAIVMLGVACAVGVWRLWPEHADDAPIPGPRPRGFDRTEALELIGWHGKVHPSDIAAFLHADMDQARGYAERNADDHGHPTVLFPFPDGKVLAVLDLRPALLKQGVQPTAP